MNTCRHIAYRWIFVLSTVVFIKFDECAPATEVEAADVQTKEPYASAGTVDDSGLMRSLTSGEEKEYRTLFVVADEMAAEARYADASEQVTKAVEYLTKILGAKHWMVGYEVWRSTSYKSIAALPEDKQIEVARAHRLRRRGSKLDDEGHYREAIQVLVEVRDLLDKNLEDKKVEPYTALLNDLAVAYNSMGRYREALEILERNNQVFLEILGEDSYITASSFDDMAHPLLGLAELDRAEKMLRQAYVIRMRILGDRHPKTVESLSNQAFLAAKKGNFREALSGFLHALETYRESEGEESPNTALAYNNVGYVLSIMGRYAEAEYFHRNCLKRWQELYGPSHPRTLVSYGNLALTLAYQGRHQEAERFYVRLIDETARQLGENHEDVANRLNNLAIIYSKQRRLDKAEESARRALAIDIANFGERHPTVAHRYANLARLLRSQNQLDEAKVLFQRALSIAEKSQGAADADINSYREAIAEFLEIDGDFDKAFQSRQEVMAVVREQMGDGSERVAEGFRDLAVNRYLVGNDTAALELLEQAVTHFDLARLSIAGDSAGRAEYSSSYSPYPLAAVMHARLGHDEAAWQMLEHHLGRGLREDLSGSRPVQGTEELLAQERKLLQRIIDAKGTADAIRRKPDDGDDDQQQLDRLRLEINTCELELAELRRAHGAQLHAADGRPFDLEKIQAAIPPNAAVVSWVDLRVFAGTTKERQEHWVCVLRHHGAPRWRRLPGSGQAGAWIANDASWREDVVEMLLSDSDAVGDEWDAVRQRVQKQRFDLIDEMLAEDEDGKQVNQLFVTPSADVDGLPLECFTDKYQISHIPSGTMLATLAAKRRDASTAAHRNLLAIGDPTFREPGNRREAWDYRQAFPSLPGTRVEVAEIAKSFPQSTLLLGRSATEQAIWELIEQEKLAQFSHLHFATHGEASEANPFDTALILAAVDDDRFEKRVAEGLPVSDERITAEQVMKTWKLDADLVMLSACRSGIGRHVSSEGFLGFSHAFLVAGARTVVVSMWDVEDRATALLTKRFYQNLAKPQADGSATMSKLAALSEAKSWLRGLTNQQVEQELQEWPAENRGTLRKRDEVPQQADYQPYAHPKYWAAFILVGDP
jgi:CHAT domain-containing protein/tetratricopeptide (TPR) repeat protein